MYPGCSWSEYDHNWPRTTQNIEAHSSLSQQSTPSINNCSTTTVSESPPMNNGPNSKFSKMATTPKPQSSQSSAYASSTASSTKSLHHSVIKSALKKPFQGWSKDLLAARDDLDDDYNFASGARRGTEEWYNARRTKAQQI
ncbi:hypothetical protein BDV96DRAFT_566552 [Lophiotrema nucula]|uniref:Uncharacterized protein n=1 Tax=Lophiotrema nucula TaxID=690887 RepID=A0A6A5ZMF9_9PLEO|nr:hypothetical protein BDV96DRAFT_566552 [Lophiotrema nucula]